MKPVNLHTLILPLIGWIYDFQKDNNRLPDSLDDLIANKSTKRDYNPGRSITRNQTEGFNFVYSAKTGVFEVKISKDKESVVYDNATDALLFYKDNELQSQICLN